MGARWPAAPAGTLAAGVLALVLACAGTVPSALPSAPPGPAVTGLAYAYAVGGRGTGRGRFTAPGGVCTDLAGNLYVADTGNDRIQKFSADGTYLAQAGGFGFGTGQFNKPAALAVNNGLELWVADTRNSRLQQYDTDLHFQAAFSPRDDDGDDLLGLPRAVAASTGGDLLVGDADEGGLYLFSPLGERRTAFGGFGYGPGRVDDPADVAVGADGNAYVCDPAGGRIAVYDRFGSYLYDLGASELDAPGGVAVDARGTVFVADTGRNRVVVFAADGTLLTAVGADGTGPAAFNAPAGVALAPGGMLFVADTGNHRVQAFRVLRERR